MKQIYKDKAFHIINEIQENQTKSQPGGLPWLLYGDDKISEQSLYIKIGRNFEKWFKFIVEDCGMELLPDGVIKNVIGKKSKDIDLLFKDENSKFIYYRELKSNLELDTEKLPATYEKIKLVGEYLTKQYKDYEISSSLLHWSVYEPDILASKYDVKIKTCNDNGVSVEYPRDLFKILSADISKKDYVNMWREIGNIL
tara:strand:- start:370 stop:963 length:594 start_codon:yes stop_codon:yes gene_type:complete